MSIQYLQSSLICAFTQLSHILSNLTFGLMLFFSHLLLFGNKQYSFSVALRDYKSTLLPKLFTPPQNCFVPYILYICFFPFLIIFLIFLANAHV